jgi:LysM repeat protein
LRIIAAAALAASAAVVVVQPGETLEQIAQRTLGDAKAAAELKALNHLTDARPAPGTSLHLPGPERARALSALVAARNALSQTDSNAAALVEASANLKIAEQLFEQARYDESAVEADATWRLLSGSSQGSTRFVVQVVNGDTQVTSKSGQPIRIESEGVTRRVQPGQALSIPRQGSPLGGGLSSPGLTSPPDQARVPVRTAEKGTASVALAWQAVAGASRYSLEIAPLDGAGRGTLLDVERPEARVSLPLGKYAWSVRAVSADGEYSDASLRRTFEVWVEPLRLEVKETHWK